MEVTRENLYDSLKKKGVVIEGYYNEHRQLLTRVTATYKGQTYDTGHTINEHCYFFPSTLRAVGYFFLEPSFKQMMHDHPELMEDYPQIFQKLISQIPA